MIKPLQGQFADWQYARGNTIRFLELLSDEDLNKKLPRKTFTTIYEQIAEMAWAQRCFLKAVEAKTIADMDWATPTFATKDDLLGEMKKFDAKMLEIFEACDGTEEVDWYGSSKSIYEHISSLQSHEMMHLGQITAFCYCLGIEIPQEINKSMFLTG
ncbi:MAG: DinB family protein [Defluviitaleaceae bacterium]|nr:DinB family protein [Defluviitaleaceae bacterium]